MKQTTHTLSNRKAAIIAGSSLFVMLAAVILAMPNTLQLVTKGDATKTAQALRQAGAMFSVGIAGWFIVQICDVVASWGFYEYFRPVNRGVSLLTAWVRLFYTALFATVTVALLIAAALVNGSWGTGSFTAAQIDQMVLLALQVFEYGWLFGLGFFGLHLFGLGYLALQSTEVPTWLGVLLIIASIGYTGDTLAFIALPHYDQYAPTIKAIVAAPNALGELSFGAWLLWKGGKQSLPKSETEG